MTTRNLTVIRLVTLLLAVALGVDGGASAATCTHYASPTGTGSGASASSPFKVANFWSLAKPGYTLCLLDGEYTGATSMINPPPNLNGSSAARITIQALNDGKVTINGQGSYIPVRLSENDYFVVEGINARNSVSTVVSISKSNNNIIRRVAAWDAADNNNSIFGIHYGSHNLLEDVAGWGVARKIYESSQDGHYTTIRRAWGRWEGSHVIGPKMTYTLAYNNTNMIIENAIGTWSGERMKSTYTLMDYNGRPWTGNGAGTYTNYGVDQPFGIFAIDGMTGSNKSVNSKLLGSIAYVRSNDRFAPAQAIMVTKLDAVEVADTIAYVQPGSHTSKRPFALYNLQTASGARLIARNLSSIGSSSSYFGTDWRTIAIAGGSTPSAVANVFNSSSGANLCYRYRDGARTTEPLWPWPMNQRIADAMVQSGRSAVNVTATIESILGSIPAACKSGGGEAPPVAPPPKPSIPNSPLNLQVTP